MESINLQLCKLCTCLALIIMLGAWSSEATSRSLQDASMHGRHEQWMVRYGRVYADNEEKEKRFKIFKENVAYIEFSNADASKPYNLRVNQFTDLTNEEFIASRNRFKAHECSTKTTSFKYENVTASVPATMDWRKKGAVTPIKDQGQCGKLEKHYMFSFWKFIYFFCYSKCFYVQSKYRMLLGIFSSGSYRRNYSTYNWQTGLFV